MNARTHHLGDVAAVPVCPLQPPKQMDQWFRAAFAKGIDYTPRGTNPERLEYFSRDRFQETLGLI